MNTTWTLTWTKNKTWTAGAAGFQPALIYLWLLHNLPTYIYIQKLSPCPCPCPSPAQHSPSQRHLCAVSLALYIGPKHAPLSHSLVTFVVSAANCNFNFNFSFLYYYLFFIFCFSVYVEFHFDCEALHNASNVISLLLMTAKRHALKALLLCYSNCKYVSWVTF